MFSNALISCSLDTIESFEMIVNRDFQSLSILFNNFMLKSFAKRQLLISQWSLQWENVFDKSLSEEWYIVISVSVVHVVRILNEIMLLSRLFVDNKNRLSWRWLESSKEREKEEEKEDKWRVRIERLSLLFLTHSSLFRVSSDLSSRSSIAT